ncbi:hypothetical protein V6K52_00955 [Knoellia sp. S7-12]|uniref:hypothetical protein n=1 Tax=Knoellia sp. S7-12 TaxID=3126698 RepID=UPI00336823B8
MSPSFSEHLGLLDLHGRAGVATLEALSPDATVPPGEATALQAAEDHWATLEIWSWSLTHPGEHWSDREDPATPAGYPALVAAIAAEIGRLGTALGQAGPDVSLDYFGRPGTTADVARLLAFEAVTMAHTTGLAAGRPALGLDPAVASDGVGQALGHWVSAQPDIVWRSRPVAIRTTDTSGVWYLSLADVDDDLAGDFRLASAESPAAVVEGSAQDVLWWLHGHLVPEVSVTGDEADVRAVKSVFLQPVEKARRPKRRWFG